MRNVLALALTLVTAGCGAAPRPAHVTPRSYVTTPARAAAVARAVLDVHYGVDSTATTERAIVGRAEWFGGTAELVQKWERGWTVIPIGVATTWFQPVAVVEAGPTGEISVRVVGRTSTNSERFEGLDGYIVTGDPQMPAWADQRVARLQSAVNTVLGKIATH
jgi:hypothetical protein